MRLTAAWVVLTLLSIQPVWAASADAVKFTPASKKDVRLLSKLLPDRMQEQFDRDVPVPQPPTIAWVSITDSEPKYFFVLLPWECGVNCTIYGFRRTSTGWAKVYDVEGGDDIVVLKSKTRGHYDIEGAEEYSAGSGYILTSHWQGDRYGKPDRKPYGKPDL